MTATGTAPDGAGTREEDLKSGAARRPYRPTLRQRLVARGVLAAVRVACRLPEGVLWRAADVGGAVAYRLARARRDRARGNLRRVVEWMAENGTGEERYRRAASDGAALEAIVRSAFKHHLRYYVEVARTPLYDGAWFARHLVVETPAEADEALGTRRAFIVVGMHFGALELPALYGVSRVGRIVAPMETLANPLVQAFMVRTRAGIGLQIVDLGHAAGEMVAALRRDEPVGLVGDRVLAGAGLDVELFGARTKIPAGPALLSVEHGVPLYVSGVRRDGPGRYRGNLRPASVPAEGSRRERVRALAQAEARLFEQVIADAPDQWYSIFFSIWPDVEPR